MRGPAKTYSLPFGNWVYTTHEDTYVEIPHSNVQNSKNRIIELQVYKALSNLWYFSQSVVLST